MTAQSLGDTNRVMVPAASKQVSPTTTRRGSAWWLASLWIPAGLLTWAASWRPEAIEHYYSGGLYPPLARTLSRMTGWLPFSCAELLVTLLGIALLCLVARGVVRFRKTSERWQTTLRRWVPRILGAGAVIYFAFLLVWGLNYRRLPFATLAGLTPSQVEVPALERLGAELVNITNTLRKDVREDATGVMQLEGDLADALERANGGLEEAARTYAPLAGSWGPPKPVYASAVLSFLGIRGIYFPFTGEANVNTSCPASTIPFSACHELAHLRGFAREDEANFIAFVACRAHTDADYRYSGYLAATLYVVQALPAGATRSRLLTSLAPGVQRDLAEQRRWRERYQTPLADLSERVNDTYLRANGEAAGTRSYGRMVQLLVAEWQNERRPAPAQTAPSLPGGPGERPATQ